MPKGFSKGDDSRRNTDGLVLGGGSNATVRKFQRQLSAALRDSMCAEYIAAWLGEIVKGNDPRIALRDVDPSTNKRRQGRPSSTEAIVQDLPDLQASMTALQILLQRRDGAPARKDELDREAAAEGAAGASALASSLAGRTPDQIRAFLDAYRVVVGGGPTPSAAPVGTAPVAQAVLQATPAALTPTASDELALAPAIDVATT
jgi:hypothetical protein